MVDISEREEELPEAVIGKLLKIASEDKSIISLGPGEPDFNMAPQLQRYVGRLGKKCNHYSAPSGRKELKEEIVKKLKKENKIKTKAENVVVTSGSMEGLLLASLCTLDVSEQILIPNPSYMGFRPMFDIINAVPEDVELKEEEKFEINPDEVRKLINKKTKVLLINSPSNPTGNVIRKNVLEELADMARDKKIYIFSDEAYEKIIYEGKHVSIGSLNGMEDYVATFHSFSKTHAMCGFRLGYCCAPEKLAKAMTKVHVYSTISAPTISQLLGIKALRMNDSYVRKMKEEYDKRRKFIVRRLNEIGMPTIMPQGAFYAFANIKNYSKNSFKFARELLEKAKVAVVPGTEFGRFGEGFIRCSYATDLRLIEKALERIEMHLK